MLSLIKNIIQEMLNDKYPEHKDINFNVSFIENKDFGDIACNVAMILAKKVKVNGRDFYVAPITLKTIRFLQEKAKDINDPIE